MMEYVNFRLSKIEKEIIIAIARSHGISVEDFIKNTIFKEMAPFRVDLEFNLLNEGKIGFKRTWKISGLTYHEFLIEWSNRGAEEKISQIAEEKGLKAALSFDLKPYFKDRELK